MTRAKCHAQAPVLHLLLLLLLLLLPLVAMATIDTGVALGEPGEAGEPPRPLRRYLFFNLFHGGRAHGAAPDRSAAIARWVRRGGFSVAAFSELNGFDETTWGAFCRKRLGLEHAIFLRTRHGYHMGLASAFPLELLFASTEAPWHHGILYAWVEALGHAVAVTHLSPVSSSARALEAKALTAAVIAEDRPVLVMGDMNTLSPADILTEATMVALQTTARLCNKFLLDDCGGLPDYAPMREILTTLVDLGDPSDWSVPTDLKVDQMHAAPVRLDFALATPSFLALGGEFARMRARCVKDNVTVHLSDHLPLVITSSSRALLEL
jgi:endonuclease/exonuclease/phosphatase family metal-dependent hydrolase